MKLKLKDGRSDWGRSSSFRGDPRQVNRSWALLKKSVPINVWGLLCCHTAMYVVLSRAQVPNAFMWIFVSYLLAACMLIPMFISQRKESGRDVYQLVSESYNFLFAATALNWGVASVAFIGDLGIEAQAIFSTITAGLMAGAVVVTLHSYRWALIVQLIYGGFYVAGSLSVGSFYFQTLGVLGAVYAVFLVLAAGAVHRLLEREFRLTMENEDLMNEIQQNTMKMMHNSKMISLGEMAGGIAHEVNNPLAIMSGLLFQLKQSLYVEDDHCQKSLAITDRIEKTLSRTVGVVSGIRRFARHSERPQLETRNLWDTVQETLVLSKSRFERLGVELRIESQPRRIDIRHDSVQVSQALLSLLMNAADAIEYLEERWVELDVQESAGKVELLVTDSGKGLPNHIAERVMDPFFTTKDVGKGTGLGLSIAYGIMKDHGGDLRLNLDHDHTQFVLSFPISSSSVAESHSNVA